MSKTQVKTAVNKPAFVEVKEELPPVAAEVEVVLPTPTATDNQTTNNILLELDQYAKAMQPGLAVPPAQGAVQQVKLFRVMERMFNRLTPEDFQVAMPKVLAWFNDNLDGVTSDAYLFRFSAEWTATANDYQAFVRLAKLLQLTADPKSNNTILPNMNFDYYLEYGLTDAGRERILAYYGK